MTRGEHELPLASATEGPTLIRDGVRVVVYQIYYDEASRRRLDPRYRHHENRRPTRYLESAVIAELLASGRHRDGDFFGVFSWKFALKIPLGPHEIVERMAADGFASDVYSFFGRARGRHPWLLAEAKHPGILDSDEVVPPGPRDEIARVVASGSREAFLIPRLNLFWGRPACLLGEDYQLRLFRKGQARYEGCHLDQRPVVRCPTACLTERLIHRQADSLAELLAKLDARTSQRARALLAELAAVQRPAPLFYHTFRYYCREQRATEDGWRGIALASIYALDPALTHWKLRRLRGRAAAGRVA